MSVVEFIDSGATCNGVAYNFGIPYQRARQLVDQALMLGLIERTGRSVGSAIEYRATHETPD